MLKLMEIGLLAVSLAVVLGLVVKGRPEVPPTSEHVIGAQEPEKDGEQFRAS
ncbi:MAG TPA: hypothetical protein VGG42_01385 [Acidobacteriaceae bacterium]|jgi:hypothetical protein